MATRALISPDGALNPSALSFALDDKDTLTIITAVAAHNVQQEVVLDDLFNSSFSSQTAEGIKSAFIKGDDSAVMAEDPHHTVVLLPEALDGPKRAREEEVERAHHLAISMADVLMLVVRMVDLGRAQANGVGSLRDALTRKFALEADNFIPKNSLSGKRGLFVVVTDYEADVVTREEIIAGFQEIMNDVYAKVVRPPGVSARFGDHFSFEFFLLPSKRAQPSEYDSAVTQLSNRLLDPADDEFLFERKAFCRFAGVDLSELARTLWDELTAGSTMDVPPTKDLMSAFDCENAMRNVFGKYQQSVRLWRREVEGGEIITDFGQQATEMLENTIAVFERDSAPHKGSSAFKRKKDELRDLLNTDLYDLFVLQIAKLREITYRKFKEKLGTTENSDPRLDRTVNAAVNESQNAFRKDAEILKPRFSTWRYDSDMKELATRMREDATDRLQRARLAEYQESGGRRTRRRRPIPAPGTKRRQPINVSFHYLDPAPFGWKDSRFDKLTIDDNLEFHGNKSPTALGASSGGYDGLSVPLSPTDSKWHNANQDFIYSEKK